MSYVVALLGIVVALLVVLVVGLLRSHAEILRSLHDLGAYADGRPDPLAGARVPPAASDPAPRSDRRLPTHLAGVAPDGDALAVPIGDRGSLLIAFLTSGCITCSSFWDALGSGRAIPGVRTVVVTRGADAESPGAVAALAPRGIATVMSSEAWHEFDVPGAPYFVQVSDGHVVGEGVATGWDQLLAMVDRSAVDAEHRDRGLTRREVLGSARGARGITRADRELRER